jgi:predicted RNA-binding Zn ribbon-like protein
LLGGRLTFDFVNTVHDRTGRTDEDYLDSLTRFVHWSAKAGAISTSEQEILLPLAGADTRALARLAHVRKLRDGVYALLRARMTGRRLGAADLELLDAWIHAAWGSLTLSGNFPQLITWKPESLNLDLPLKRIALSTLAVIQESDPKRVKECPAPGGCGWLFLDETRNNSRRWCSMELCGNTVKIARFRRRRRSRR